MISNIAPRTGKQRSREKDFVRIRLLLRNCNTIDLRTHLITPSLNINVTPKAPHQANPGERSRKESTHFQISDGAFHHGIPVCIAFNVQALSHRDYSKRTLHLYLCVQGAYVGDKRYILNRLRKDTVFTSSLTVLPSMPTNDNLRFDYQI